MDSIDSSIFKHSLHQSSLEKSNTLKTNSTKIVSRAEIHNDSISTDSGDENVNLKNVSNINEDTESGITIIEIKDRKQSSGPASSVISYDSIYLSSESDRETVLGDKIENIDEQIKDFEEIIKELRSAGENGKVESIIDNLYSQVGKGKAEVALKTTTDTLSKFTDYISRGTLERITIFAQRVENERKQSKSSSEYQYSSLPDAGISKLLRDCELIDAKLRDDVSIELLEPFPDYDSLPNEVNESEDVSVCKSNRAIRVGGSESVKSAIEPNSIEENEKGAPSIELVPLPTRELNNSCQNSSSKGVIESKNNTTKIYLPEIGVEFDYENSIASFDSDGDFETPAEAFYKPPCFNLVTISGRKVIVDELAAKVEHDSNQKAEKGKSEVQPIITATVNSSASDTRKSDDNNSSRDKQKAHSDKDKKIKLSGCKQEVVESSNKTVLRKALEEDKRVAAQSGSDYKTCRLVRRNCHSFNMPRPQLLSIVDSKNSVPKKDMREVKKDVQVENKGEALNQTEQEFLHKVDSVRNYWSKMLYDERDEPSGNLKQMAKNLSSKSSNDIPQTLQSEDFQSFFPSVEIVELNGETQAALVTSRKLNDVEFDHVRYKVMKSDMFQKNLLVSNRKETQFDGLMQYLQDYSFQELLANNNGVIVIEPVRTKIEKVTDQPNKAQSATCKITNGALTRNGSNNLKKHFFYHPIRVNKELYEEELPVPDTVRNVRKLFEGSLKRCVKPDDTKLNDADNLRRKTIRYLTIDTSFDNNSLGVTKWDSISLSSGVSSAADLNSPCECQETSNKDIKFVCTSKDNLDNVVDEDDESKSHYVSDDVLEKIRECGSSITYYGGHASDKKGNSDMMTKAIMREISNQKCHCHSSRRQRHSNDKPLGQLGNDYLGE